jgi:transglutaminase-like putative cysteine protease
MFYSIRHVTKFRYSNAVRESVMEVRMQPRTEGSQRTLAFALSVSPKARVFSYRDYLGNMVHHFDVPGNHSKLLIVAESLVDSQSAVLAPEQLTREAWDDLDQLVGEGDHQEMLAASQFAGPTPLLKELSDSLDVRRRDDPLTLLRQINSGVYEWFDYEPKSTQVDSPIDHALAVRKGVCQDFAHVMISLVRQAGIPCRYVSGYLFHSSVDNDRSVDGATHAWVEALLPNLGWVGFDPTNNLAVGGRHIRTAIGRDYADVPPTKGVYKGGAESELSVAVRVALSDSMPPPEEELVASNDWSTFLEKEEEPAAHQQQQQQQQQ